MSRTSTFLLIIFCFLAMQLKAQVNVGDSLALVDLYNSTNGPGWVNKTNWLTSEPLDEWWGITVIDNRVDSIGLDNNNLKGKIPPSLGNLLKLEYLTMDFNRLVAKIPSSLGKLINLKSLDLSFNNLTGIIPASLGNLSKLVYLDLYRNQLIGNIPTTFSNMKNITELYLGSNKLSGEIPAFIGSFKTLKSLDLAYAQFVGAVPEEIGNLINLTDLHLETNQLTNIPESITRLTKLEYLNISNNQIEQNLPDSIGNLVNLKILRFNYNKFSGAIPFSLGNLKLLSELYLDHNQLTGSIPLSIGNCTELVVLYLDHNQLSGRIPSPIGSLTKVRYFYLNDNKLTGPIPNLIGNLSSVEYFYVQNNFLSGPIPSSIGRLSKLFILNMGNNKLTGSIPASFALFSGIFEISLWGNELSGEIPYPTSSRLVNPYVEINDNRYNFAGLEPSVSHYKHLTYTPQKNIPINKTNNILSVSAGGTISNNTYKWYENGLLVQTKKGDSTFAATDAGTYYATVTNSMVKGLTLQSDSITITEPIAFGYESTVKDQPSFFISPNPAANFITLSLPQNISSVVLVIYDMNGKQVMKQNIISSTQKINISPLAAGEYVLHILYDGREDRRQFIKQ